mgnify:CR=1 FL=1
MQKEKETEKRVQLITRTKVINRTYNLYSMESGRIVPLAGEESVTMEEKPTNAWLNKKAKEHGVKQVIAECVDEKTLLVGMPVTEFYSLAKEVVDGKLVD